MDNSEILNELAGAIGKIVDEKVAAKTENKFSLNNLFEMIKNNTLDRGVAKNLLVALSENYEEVFNESATELGLVAKDDIDVGWIENNVSDSEIEQLAEENGFKRLSDLDEDDIYDNAIDSVLRDIAKRYVEDNL